MWKEDAFLLKTAKQVAQPWRTHIICIPIYFYNIQKSNTHTDCTSNCMSIHPYFFCSFIFIVLSFLILHSLSQNILLLFKSVLQVFFCFIFVFSSVFFSNVIFTTFSFCLSFFRSFACLAAFVCLSVNAHCMSLYLTLFQKLIPMEMYILAMHVAVAMPLPLPLPLCQHSSLTWAVCVVCSKQQALFWRSTLTHRHMLTHTCTLRQLSCIL